MISISIKNSPFYKIILKKQVFKDIFQVISADSALKSILSSVIFPNDNIIEIFIMICRVITDISLDREFDYLVPAELENSISIGMAVDVPFGKTLRNGYVVAVGVQSSVETNKLRPLAGIKKQNCHIPENLIKLGKWMASYYCCSYEHAIRTLLPAAVRNGKIRTKTRKVYSIAKEDEAQKLIREVKSDRNRGRIAILNALFNAKLDIGQLRLVENFSESALRTLVKNAVVTAFDEEIQRSGQQNFETAKSMAPEPTPAQKKALDVFSDMLSQKELRRTMLLHGVTNSGKTEVYMQMIDMVVKAGKSAIVLVPEISLTPQTVRRFRARFGDSLSILHSRLTDSERFEQWNRINRNEVKIAVGARSALFAPFRNLGVIIVDEEHESSYKQSEAPRYIARDVAVMRGELEHCCVILGSATPCAETAFNAQNGKFVLVEMRDQVACKPAPRITVLDRRLDPAPTPGENRVFSPVLIEAVRRKIENSEQCILFLNRRGFARSLSCPQCGYEACCPECSVPGTGHSTPFVYSRSKALLTCHLCGRSEPAPEFCPDCKSSEIRFSGTGTEKLESISRGAFPFAKVGRMDSDSMRSAEDYERVLEDFRRGNLDILIGTQMIAKGLHFPNVTLVGIVNADLGLMIPDFRASEKVFQLITQVAGRAGRGDHPGEVIIQTANPGNDTIDFAANLDFEGFRNFDLEFRKLLNYPPYSRIILLNFRGENEKSVAEYAQKIHNELLPYIHEDITMTPPSPAPIERIKGKFRYQILIKGNKLKTLREAVRILVLHRTPPKNVEFYADVDPQSLL